MDLFADRYSNDSKYVGPRDYYESQGTQNISKERRGPAFLAALLCQEFVMRGTQIKMVHISGLNSKL